MNKKAVSVLLCITILSIGFGVYGLYRADLSEKSAAYARERAMGDLITSVSTLDGALEKCQYASGAFLCTSAAEVWREASNAAAALSQLPIYDENLEKTQRYIAQAGGYAFSLLRSAAAGTEPTAQERDNLRSLASAADALADGLYEIKVRMDEGALAFGTAPELAVSAASVGDDTDYGIFGGVENEFPEYAGLIYDGPFSDHLSRRTPQYIKGRGVVGDADARRRAAAVLGEREDVIMFAGEGGGSVPVYSFSSRSGATVDISKQGGAPVMMLSGREVMEYTLSAEQALSYAAAFLEKNGFADMTETYYYEREGVLTANFAAEKEGTIFYPDLVKVSVALDNGEILGFEAMGYIENHRERETPAAPVSEEAAKAALVAPLAVQSHRMAVIPTPGENEVYCHEFLCKEPDGRSVLVYVNAATGQQESILLLLQDENGTLVM